MTVRMIRCPCCGCLTIGEEYDICEVCFWEYDTADQEDPDNAVGPNKVTLNQARENYKKFGACEERFIEFVRKPTDEEL